MQWNAVIFGPHETPFEDGTFKLMVSCFTAMNIIVDFYGLMTKFGLKVFLFT